MYNTPSLLIFKAWSPQKNSWVLIAKTAGFFSHISQAAWAGSHPSALSTSGQWKRGARRAIQIRASGSASARSRPRNSRSRGVAVMRPVFSASTTCKPFFSTSRACTTFPGSRCGLSFEVIFRALVAFAVSFPNFFVKSAYLLSASRCGTLSSTIASLKYSCTRIS